VTLVAEMVGSNRILPAQKIVSPLGNSALGPEDEKNLRRSLVRQALVTLQTELEGQKVFS
jgi:glycine/betaine/sarcosine/D-proline reductase family selenoprotein B